MRYLFLAIIFLGCHAGKKASTQTECYTGKLLVKGICSQRVISVEDGSTAGLSVNPAWVNPFSGDTLRNVFSVENICDFPPEIDSGVVFKFRISKKTPSDCITCKAYTPVPDEKNIIEVCVE